MERLFNCHIPNYSTAQPFYPLGWRLRGGTGLSTGRKGHAAITCRNLPEHVCVHVRERANTCTHAHVLVLRTQILICSQHSCPAPLPIPSSSATLCVAAQRARQVRNASYVTRVRGRVVRRGGHGMAGGAA